MDIYYLKTGSERFQVTSAKGFGKTSRLVASASAYYFNLIYFLIAASIYFHVPLTTHTGSSGLKYSGPDAFRFSSNFSLTVTPMPGLDGTS